MNSKLARIFAATVAVAIAFILTSTLALASSGMPVSGGTPPSGTPKTYYFTWYDSTAANGMAGDWIVIGNLEDYSATAQVYLGDQLMETVTIAPHDRQPISWPNTIGGPVKVVSPSGATLVVTQRVLYGDSFNEVGAIEADNLNTTYDFTWYDSTAANGMKGNWILVANPSATSADVQIKIGGAVVDQYTLPPGAFMTPQYHELMSGPVEVTSTNGTPILASQRVLWGGSFNEVMGMPESKLGNEYFFTWYDMTRSSGMTGNWILMSNLNDATVHADVYIGNGGVPRGSYAIGPNQSVTPVYPDLMDGPVRVVCTDCAPGQNILVSQRILFKDSFEEVQGTPQSGLTEREFFGWYDFTAANSMRGNWLLIANFGLGNTTVDVYIGNASSAFATFTIPEGGRVTPQFPEVMGGPIRVVSRENNPLMVSQRTVYKGSFNELLGLTKDDVGQVATETPDLRLQKLGVRWASMSDYQNHLLSVDLSLANVGQGTALGATVTSINATNGVTVSSPATLPLALGDIAGGGHADFSVVYNVPTGVTGFTTSLHASCTDSGGGTHTYPGP